MIVVVPARGGSKGVPGKNVRPLAGQPLIVHTLRAALACDAVARVIVSTDDDEIIGIARAVRGVEIPFRRPRHLASDSANAIDTYLHVAAALGVTEGVTPRELCVLLPTAPLRLPGDIAAAIDLFRRTDADAVVSVTEAKPAQWLQEMDGDGRLHKVVASDGLYNRQAYPRVYLPNGSIYVLAVEALRRTRDYFGPRTFGYPMPRERAIDIDTEADFLAAEALMTQRMDHGDDRALRRAV